MRQLRAILPLGKFPVVKRDATSMTIRLGGTTEMLVPLQMNMYDIHDGDLLTLYTEVLIKPQGVN